MAARGTAGAWVLVLSLWGEPLPPTCGRHCCPFPRTYLESGRCSSSSPAHPVLILSPICLLAPPPWCCLPGTVVGGQNLTVRIGKPLVLNCKGAPRKPPQQLEWKLNTGRTEAWKVLSPRGEPWDSVARVLPNGSLLLPAIGIQDEGTFQCRAMTRKGKETKSNYQVRVYQIPGKPEIVDPASELKAGVPSKVGTCVSEGGYPAGTLSWHLDGKPLMPDGKGVFVKEETRRHPESGLFTLQSELMVTPAQGGASHPTFSCSFSPGLPQRRALHTAPIQLSVWGEHRAPEPAPLDQVQVVVEPEGGAVALGGTVTLTCEAPTQPPPQIHWIKDGAPLPHPPSPVLLIPEVRPQDQGTYSCVATHPGHRPQESRAISISIIETGKEGPTAGKELSDKLRGAATPQYDWRDGQKKESLLVGLRPPSSLFPCRLCGRAWAGNSGPGPGDPRRPRGSSPVHWGHHVAKASTPRRGEEGPRKPGGGGGRACRAESVGGA
ncbi:advanced glycosylation end product-specific receptor isoform X2 [Artibeus jamaicensis]|uniref:advanced glycosylation end product-specific receptor isoform X2 n=1 Tax=Artibeus jamaicensis TaxID=9417 RepID=UPI00235AC573|nr:advanced glycosylation end product-specific receptor isoform X2 [Artibeus jamaicensis]